MRRQASLGWITNEARRLASAGALHGRGWSLAQICEHLALALAGTARDPQLPATTERSVLLVHLDRLRRMCMKHALLLTGRFPPGVPAPAFVVPSNSPPLDAAIRQLDEAIHEFERKLAQPAARWPAHPVLGTMSGAQWRRFHCIHAKHHFACVQGAADVQRPAAGNSQ
jgi:hypothetical protein